MKDIRDYLPKKEKMTMLQVKMPKNLVSQVREEMKSDNVETWTDFLTACFKNYLDNKAQTANTESSSSHFSKVNS